MNDKLQAALADIVTILKDGAAAATEAGKEQVPLLVQEYLAWGFWRSVLSAALLLLVAAVVWKIRPRIITHFTRRVAVAAAPNGYGSVEDARIGLYCWGHIGPAAAVVLALTFAVWHAAVVLQISIAPRVYLLERIAELVK